MLVLALFCNSLYLNRHKKIISEGLNIVGQTNQLTDQIVHESEAQRQFVRLQMPAQIQMSNIRYSIKDLSSGGLGIFGLDPAPKKGETLEFELVLPFMDFALDIKLKAEAIHVDKKNKLTGCRFIDVNQNQVSILNHVIKSFMAGDIVSASEILNVVSRENFVNVRKHGAGAESSKGAKLKQYGIYTLLALATVGLGFFIFNNILDNMLVIKSANSQVNAQTMSVLAPASGVYTPLIAAGAGTVDKGATIGSITNAASGVSVRVVSPCDCFIRESTAIGNGYFAEGSSLFTLIPRQSNVMIESFVPMADASKIKIGTSAIVRIAGAGIEIEGKVIDMKAGTNVALIGEQPQSLITIKPSKPLSADNMDRPAFVEFHL